MGMRSLYSAEFQRNHPCSVIVPEVMDWVCPAVAQTIQRLIFDFRIKYKLDICRTYLVGAGYGAIGAWHLAGSYPRLFAAMVAIGGCADPYHIRNAKYMPIWAFHAANDPKIHVSEATQLGGRKYLAGSQTCRCAAHRGLRIGPVYRVHIRSRRAGRTGHAIHRALGLAV